MPDHIKLLMEGVKKMEWISEKQSEHLTLSTEIEEVLYSGHSEFQTIDVVQSKEFGRMLVLDGVFQTSEKEEFVYHESIVHIPLYLHPNPKRVLIIGGGDGGAARECVRHPEVEEVRMVEIDGTVVELAKQYLPFTAATMTEGHPKLTVTIGDGLAHVKEKADYYDVIIVDCSDPIGPGEGLFTKAFYQDAYHALREDGILVQQTESPFMHQPLVKACFKEIGDIYPIARLYTAFIPLYPSGMHCFTIGSKKYDPLQWQPSREQTLPMRYYNYGIQKAAFALPTFVKDLLTEAKMGTK